MAKSRTIAREMFQEQEIEVKVKGRRGSQSYSRVHNYRYDNLVSHNGTPMSYGATDHDYYPPKCIAFLENNHITLPDYVQAKKDKRKKAKNLVTKV